MASSLFLRLPPSVAHFPRSSLFSLAEIHLFSLFDDFLTFTVDKGDKSLYIRCCKFQQIPNGDMLEWADRAYLQ